MAFHNIRTGIRPLVQKLDVRMKNGMLMVPPYLPTQATAHLVVHEWSIELPSDKHEGGAELI